MIARLSRRRDSGGGKKGSGAPSNGATSSEHQNLLLANEQVSWLERRYIGVPPVRNLRSVPGRVARIRGRALVDFGDFLLAGHEMVVDGVPVGLGPRRGALDGVLVSAAVEAGAELQGGVRGR